MPMYSVQRTCVAVHCTLDVYRCMLCTVHWMYVAVHCTLDVYCCTCRCTLYTGRMPLYAVHCMYAVVHCALHVCQCTLDLCRCKHSTLLPPQPPIPPQPLYRQCILVSTFSTSKIGSQKYPLSLLLLYVELICSFFKVESLPLPPPPPHSPSPFSNSSVPSLRCTRL